MPDLLIFLLRALRFRCRNAAKKLVIRTNRSDQEMVNSHTADLANFDGVSANVRFACCLDVTGLNILPNLGANP